MFKELRDDPFYIEYRKYDRCVLDYCILESTEYNGKKTHKEAVIFSMKKMCEEMQEKIEDVANTEKMQAKLINSNDFFKLPENYKKERNNALERDYHRPYWFLFLNPPYETCYTIQDFVKINNILFPSGKEGLEIYDWNVNWSSYFDEGLEWWGAMCTSIYDKTLKRFVIIFASATD